MNILRILSVGIVSFLSISGCIPLPGNSKFFKYEIDLSANGQPYKFQQYFECYQQADWSEADGKFHRHWNQVGAGATTTDIGDGLVLLFYVSGDCDKDFVELPKTGTVISTATNPEQLYVIRPDSKSSSIVIHQQTISRVDNFDGHVGPTKEQAELKELIRSNQNGFQRVTARIIPYEVWATSDRSRAYFDQFKSVAIANVGDVKPRNGWPDSFVQFPFVEDRNYKYGKNGEITKLNQIELVYTGDAFVAPDSSLSVAQAWFSTAQTKSIPCCIQTPKFAIVNYKGTLIKVKESQEIYDPQSKEILLLTHWHRSYPWGGPDAIDLRRGRK